MGELREINLEAGMPLVADALRRLTFEVHHSTGTARPARAAKFGWRRGSGWTF